MTHGDDAGLRLPPRVAPVQTVIVLVKDDPELAAAAAELARELGRAGLRVRVDDRTDVGLGRRLTDWELKGVPVRIEIGTRDLAQGTVNLARRDRPGREPVTIDAASTAAGAAIDSVHDALLAQAAELLRSRTVEVEDLDAAAEAARDGFARLPWAACGPEGERRLNAAGLTVRCLTSADGSVPAALGSEDLFAIVARAY